LSRGIMPPCLPAGRSGRKPRKIKAARPFPKHQQNLPPENLKTLRAVKKAVEDLDKDVASGKDITLQLEALQGHKQAIESVDPQIRADFSATEKFLKDKKLPQVILDRHAKAVADYDINYKTLKGNLDSIIQLEADRKQAEAQNDHSLHRVNAAN